MFFQHPEKRSAVLLDQKGVASVSDFLGGAAAFDENTGGTAGSGFRNDDPVRVKSRGKKKQVRQGIQVLECLAVADRTGETALLLQAEFLHVFFDILTVHTVSDQQHGEFLTAVLELFQGIEKDTDPFVPHQPAHKEIDWPSIGDAVFLAQSFRSFRAAAAFLEINAVAHNDVISLIPQFAQVLSGTFGNDPDLIGIGDILDELADGEILQDLRVDRPTDVDIEFGVVMQDDRSVDLFTQSPGQDHRRDRAVTVQDVDVFAGIFTQMRDA